MTETIKLDEGLVAEVTLFMDYDEVRAQAVIKEIMAADGLSETEAELRTVLAGKIGVAKVRKIVFYQNEYKDEALVLDSFQLSILMSVIENLKTETAKEIVKLYEAFE